MKLVKFKGRKYLLVPEARHGNGNAIATKKQFENGLMSHAHLFRDGIIRRFNVEIGTKDDLEPAGEYEPKLKIGAFQMLAKGNFIDLDDDPWDETEDE